MKEMFSIELIYYKFQVSFLILFTFFLSNSFGQEIKEVEIIGVPKKVRFRVCPSTSTIKEMSFFKIYVQKSDKYNLLNDAFENLLSEGNSNKELTNDELNNMCVVLKLRVKLEKKGWLTLYLMRNNEIIFDNKVYNKIEGLTYENLVNPGMLDVNP